MIYIAGKPPETGQDIPAARHHVPACGHPAADVFIKGIKSITYTLYSEEI